MDIFKFVFIMKIVRKFLYYTQVYCVYIFRLQIYLCIRKFSNCVTVNIIRK